MYDHLCPDLDFGSGKKNITKSRCLDRVAIKADGCRDCRSRVGYVAPRKKKRAGPGRPPKPPKPPGKRMCDCGRHKLKKHSRKCVECLAENRVKSQTVYKEKEKRRNLEKKIKVYENRLIKYRKRLSELI